MVDKNKEQLTNDFVIGKFFDLRRMGNKKGELTSYRGLYQGSKHYHTEEEFRRYSQNLPDSNRVAHQSNAAKI